MPHDQQDTNTYEQVMELLATEGMSGAQASIEVLLNAAMRIEREKHLGAKAYERSAERRGYANGYKPKTLQTRLGLLELSVPQVRDSSFYPASLERGMRSERALKLALAQMYIQGVSTRKVAAITEKLCGSQLSSSQVSRVSAELDESLQKWRERPLGAVPFVSLDARYEKVRHGGHVVDVAVLIARGVLPDGKPSILGVSVSLSEAEVHWREFLQSLQKRGLHGVELITSDAHAGLGAARKAVFPAVPWQRCQFHLQQNASQYVPKQSMKAQVAADLRAIFTAPNRSEADRLLRLCIDKYQEDAPKLSEWMEHNVPQGLTVMAFADVYRAKLRTTNHLERLNREIKRRTQVVSIFPNEESCLRLISAILAECDETWQSSDKIYINPVNALKSRKQSVL